MRIPTVACALFEGRDVPVYSRDIYDPEWVDKLFRGVKRNTTKPFRFVCMTDFPPLVFDEPIKTIKFKTFKDNWLCLMEAFRVTGDPVMMLGLDTIITGDLDEILDHRPKFAMLKDPYQPQRMCNGVTMWQDRRDLYDRIVKEGIGRDCYMGGHPSEMLWLAKHGHPTDLADRFPGQIKSYKAEVKKGGIEDARIVYFHGREKPHEIDHPVLRHWL